MLFKLSKYYLFAAIGLVLIASCNKEISDGNFTTYAGNEQNDTSWSYSTITSLALQRISDSTSIYKYNDTLLGSNGKTIIFSDHFSLILPPNAFVNNAGAIVTGAISIRVILLDEKSEFIRSIKSSLNNENLLESDLAFCIIATAYGQELSIAPGVNYKIRVGNKDDIVKQNMKVYKGDESIVYTTQLLVDPLFNWNENTALDYLQSVFKQPGNSGSKEIERYEITTNKLRWISLARPLYNIGNKGKFNIILPPNFTNKNTIAFITTDDYNSVIQLKPELSSRSFAANNIPLQKKIHIVTISLIGTQFYYSEQSIKALNNTPVLSLKPQKKTLGSIIADLKKL
ncbi:hypothetical protein [Sediminibacterium sp.]|uniref:hypothetical protein n=1 Tax=Sediminibacterium sp. TaxID=1917865 RepID=UPI002734B0B9|nr:hypothetical protein [Sediminibacterium sp.]MDP3393559.1 hypothetical protein [Sediminibacterium sp.]MDP3566669.1 hypothetical protein [Sediminibacterium sp.]